MKEINLYFLRKAKAKRVGIEEMHCFNLRLLGLDTCATERQYAAPEFSAVSSSFTIYTISIRPALCDQLVLDLKVDEGNIHVAVQRGHFDLLQYNGTL